MTGTRSDGKPLYNIIFIIVDQQTHKLLAGPDFSLPAMDAIAGHGVTFANHYIASAMCTASRAAFLTGRPPQSTGCIDQMQYAYSPTLDPGIPNMGSVLRDLGYKTAYFGKFEMDKEILDPKPTVNYSQSIARYGFDLFSAGGDIGSAPRSGFDNDPFIAGESIRWLRATSAESRRTGQPFFMVASFVNPHDIMFGDANVPGEAPVQKPVAPMAAPPAPRDPIYEKRWSFTLPKSLHESLDAPGMPDALAEYAKGWDSWSGAIPTEREDMWTIFYNYYLNAVRDGERCIQQVVDVLNDRDLWRDTVVVFTADHGELAGAHGGLKGKGPFAYEQNAHVPLIIAHPEAKAGTACSALTSHLDLLPTFVGLTGLPDDNRHAAVKDLTGHDFSRLLTDPESASVQAIRPAVLFNYLGVSTVDGDYLQQLMSSLFTHKPVPPIGEAKLDKRGLVSFVFDGRYKFARFYAPTAFNTPQTLEEIFGNNDVQLFDVQSDPEEVHNLALEPEKNRELILRMNQLLNERIAAEVGVNDGRFLELIIGSN
ncbi:MAG: sulfatase-like hydrolase/transferase [Candidatus Eremiobacteraeota bacterium]|nr:sulfatase-like hydrolase/transferase [Candidatus Eremiobacteraeota bacterium]